MNIPIHVIEKMFQNSSNEILLLDENTINEMRAVAFFEEWVIANCDGLTDEETGEYLGLMLSGGSSKAEKFYFNHLNAKNDKYHKCFDDIVINAQQNRK